MRYEGPPEGYLAEVWFPTGTEYKVARRGTTILCKDRFDNLIDPVPDAVLRTREYPAWALIRYPDEFRQALSVDTEVLTIAMGLSECSAAAFAQLADRLPPHHRPVFLEFVGRLLTGWGEAEQAAILLDLARTIGAEYGTEAE
ncbi:hypothetical protein [Nocardia arthritidis]|uniref:Uncharacterized protein n=1 Tax=Nocardia arthritidis TaxID=228602 RepID=A0A6G9YUV5_9NOCA|nr:hypothetical protein [Nocardia arthritidis]QIS16786.1 hypothetical protein F5544_44915 [Nocardia arthritidis]